MAKPSLGDLFLPMLEAAQSLWAFSSGSRLGRRRHVRVRGGRADGDSDVNGFLPTPVQSGTRGCASHFACRALRLALDGETRHGATVQPMPLHYRLGAALVASAS